MTVFRIKLNVKAIKDPRDYHQITEAIVLDERSGERFLQELDRFLSSLNQQKLDNNAKIKQLKYFIQSYKLQDITYDTNLITINAERNISNKEGDLRINFERFSYSFSSQ